MVSITVRVTPRAGRTAVERGPGGEVLVRVRAAPAEGAATAEAARALAAALGVPPTTVRLRTGTRSRTKVFDVRGLSSEGLAERLQRL